MVNDPTTNDLIRWSDEGDSFFGKLQRMRVIDVTD